ncbi:ABC transporter substrate-binding protein [Halorhabdus salina]|uniref:ABC transporter substrate-binding protein n=1 Tax=Halorhabdus salina TaxID=2750670 RepID=UPI0015EFC0BF|nr:ABC transporter substrate-binding protein [Halorhabdus salina]
MKSRRSFLGAVGATAVMGLSGCAEVIPGSDTSSARNSRAVTDGYDRTVSVPETVKRVVAVGPGALRQVAYLDATDRVVGVEQETGSILTSPYNLANPDLQDHQKIGMAGPNAGGNSEQILAVNPDVIFYYGERSRVPTLQSQTDTPVVGLDIVDFVDREARETMFETWRLLGDVLDERSRAGTLITFVEDTIADLRERADGVTEDDRERAYVGAINYKGAHGLATTRKQFAPFRWSGVENVASTIDSDAASVQVSTERLLAWDPATMFVSGVNVGRVREDVATNPEYESLAAIETDETYSILPHASYHHNYGSILANAYFVGKRVSPDRFGDVSLESKTKAIFETMLGDPLFESLTDPNDAYQRLDLQ